MLRLASVGGKRLGEFLVEALRLGSAAPVLGQVRAFGWLPAKALGERLPAWGNTSGSLSTASSSALRSDRDRVEAGEQSLRVLSAPATGYNSIQYPQYPSGLKGRSPFGTGPKSIRPSSGSKV